ncbi:MAG: hypothetical protein FWF80_09040 [Defluviitaleaceae bacterium]|nr:hypothetical protein [Defluviitaleaceae bacterium]
MDFMRQTSKTMLFEQINKSSDVPCLSVLLTAADENAGGAADKMTDEIIKKLTVESFEDFISKFRPTIYASYSTVADYEKITNEETGEVTTGELLGEFPDVQYYISKDKVLDKPFVDPIELNLTHPVVRMLVKTIKEKGITGTPDIDCDFKSLLAELAPKREFEIARGIQKSLDFLFKKYKDIEDDSPEKREYAVLVNKEFEKIAPFRDKPEKLIPIAAARLEEKLSVLADDAKSQNKGANNANVIRTITDGRIAFTAKGPSVTLPPAVSDTLNIEQKDEGDAAGTALSVTDGEKSDAAESVPQTLSELFNYDFDRTASKDKKGMSDEEYEDNRKNTLQILRDVFLPAEANGTSAKEDVVETVDRYNSYMDLYKRSQKKLVKVAKPLLETLIGVYLFFQQSEGLRYSPKEAKLKPKLFFTNNTYNDLFGDENVEKKLNVLLKTINSTRPNDAVWFAIVPGLMFESKDAGAEGYSGPLETEAESESSFNDPLTVAQMKRCVQFLGRQRIQMFFSFETSNSTTFNDLQEKGIGPFSEKLELLDGERYAIPCIPNFSLIPGIFGKTNFGKTFASEDVNGEAMVVEQGEGKTEWISGIDVSSCYVAAGLAAAWQMPKFLTFKLSEAKVKNLTATESLPGVRLNIESDDLSLILTTSLGRGVYGLPDDMVDEIKKESAGFVFSSNSRFLNGTPVNKLTVQIARCMLKGATGYEPFYYALTERFVLKFISEVTGNEAAKLAKFFTGGPEHNVVGKWRKLSVDTAGRSYANAVLRTDDLLKLEPGDEGLMTVQLNFGGVVTYCDIEITSGSN